MSSNDTAVWTAYSLDQYVRFNGVSPEDLFQERLTNAGSDTWGPDPSGERTSNCPAHKDERASLRWTVSSSGVVKFHCLAGCDFASITKELELRGFDLRWASVDFSYWDLDTVTGELEYLFDVRRYNKADAVGKTYLQFRRQVLDEADGMGTGTTEVPGNGLSGRDNGPLWLWPALLSRAEDARSAGQALEIVICEGEKDAYAIWKSGSVGAWDFITSAAGGAGGWRERHTADLLSLAERGLLSRVVVLCDPDKAGKARGPEIVSALEAAFGDEVKVPVEAWTTDGTDIADLADREGAGFWDKLTVMTGTEMLTSMEEGSLISGSMTRGGMPGRPGQKAMAVVKGDDALVTVIPAEFRPRAAWDTGWLIDLVMPDSTVVSTTLERADLGTRASFEKWLVANGLQIPIGCPVGSVAVAQALGVWLNWYCKIDPTVRKMKSTQYLTWVDSDGNPAKEPERKGATFITGDPDLDADKGFMWTGTDILGRWDYENSEIDAAWAWAQSLTFGDERTVAAVAGWACSVLVSPWLSRWTTTKPGLAVVAISDSGKTHGASRMLLQLAGCRGNATGTIAAIRRQFSAGGVSTIRWIDDAGEGMLESPSFKEILRVTTSQSDHSLSTPDDGAMATHSAQMTGCPVISAEGMRWMKETAMLDRFLLVQPLKPSGRKSLRADREGQRQWDDVEELQDAWGKDWASMAGWTVDGIRAALGEHGLALREIVEQVGRPGNRGDIGAWYAAVGVRLLRRWLQDVRDRAGDQWPGAGPEWLGDTSEGVGRDRVRQWDWLVEWADARLVEEKHGAQTRYGSLVTQVLPLLFTRAASTEKSQWKTELWSEVPCSCSDENGFSIRPGATPNEPENGDYLKASVRAATSGQVNGTELGMPLVLMETCGALWVDTRGLAAWYKTDPIGRSSEERVTGTQALADQARAVSDTPDWAVWKKHPGHGRPPIEVRELRLTTGKGASGMVRYVRLSKDASRAAREDD